MGKKTKNQANKPAKKPFVSICTPTFNRRPFIPIAIQCFMNQTYPKDKMEWIIIDDGTDKIEDLVAHIPQVKYFKYDEKMTIGKKRNLSNEMATGDIIVYMDDDDYYPPDRVEHAVERLRNSKALCAGSSAMFIHFKHIDKMYLFGPYGPNHATAATFAFKRELLSQTRFSEASSVAEEKTFLKDYTIPFVQLDSKKTILVVSHNHNSFDKKELLKHMPNPNVHETDLRPSDLIKEPDLLKFFMEDVDPLLENYEPGRPENKPDVLNQLASLRQEREAKMQEEMRKQMEQIETLQKIKQLTSPQPATNELTLLREENQKLKSEVEFLKGKIRQLIQAQIEKKKAEATPTHASPEPENIVLNIHDDSGSPSL